MIQNSDFSFENSSNQTKYYIPLQFSLIVRGLYRSSYPSSRTLPFISTLNLKSMICLDIKLVNDELRMYCQTNEIILHEFNIGTNHEPFLFMNGEAIQQVISISTNEQNQPCLIFDNKGKNQVCCVIGCLRRTLNWCITSIIHEYELFMTEEYNSMDVRFIESYKHNAKIVKD